MTTLTGSCKCGNVRLARCGSRLFSADGHEAEIKLGILTDAPTPLTPTYELWIKRRETWLQSVEGAEQFIEDRT
jgi:hypothetical protein